MADVRPFAALRPKNDLAEQVIAPPYDVLTDEEARTLADHPHSFVRVTRPEATLPPGCDPHSDRAYHRAKENLDSLVEEGVMVRDPEPTFYFYGQTMGSHHQVGILAGASVDAYDRGEIRKHEYTRPDKEDDRTHHMDVLNAQVGLVFLTYRPTPTLSELTLEATSRSPDWKVTTDDGVVHALWSASPTLVPRIQAAFAEVDTLYIADGHHRSAAASRIHSLRDDAPTEAFLAGLYPADSLQILSYNRVVHDLEGLSPEAFRARLARAFELTPTSDPRPPRRGTFTMYLAGEWTLLTPRAEVVASEDPVARLDVSILQDHVLAPILKIDDPRRSTRIHFVGGIRGHQALEQDTNACGGVAFHLYPTPLEQLFDVADSGRVMPPKSTWFEPKLREGVVVRLLG